MNKEKAITSFMKNAGSLSRLPLITDPEMIMLFGEEIAAILNGLSKIDTRDGICSKCEDKCCRLVKCELFSPRFDHCPIHDFRPVICRLHYCLRFPPENDEAIKDLADMLLESLASAERIGKIDTTLFDSPPLEAGCPSLVKLASPLVQAVDKGLIEPQAAAGIISAQTEQYRSRRI